MPGLIAFNRRWGIGSDDFVFPAIAELALRVVWFAAVLIVYVKHKHHLVCGEGPQILQIYIGVLLVGTFFIILLDALIAYISSQGTITQIQPRRHLPKVLYLRFLVVILEIAWNGMGTKWAITSSDHQCETSDVILLIQFLVVCSWFLVLAIFVGSLIVFDPLGRHSHMVSSNHRVGDVEHGEPRPLYINLSNAGVEKAKRVWEWRMRLLFCCCGAIDKRNKSAYTEIARLFAGYFEELDLVSSDIAAGLILLHQKQASEKITRISTTSQQSEGYSIQSPDSMTSTGAVQGSIISSPGVFIPVPHQFWMTVEMACHFMKFARGSYGWPLYLFHDGVPGFCKMLSEIRCCACCCKSPSYVVEDNCCHCHTAALKQVTGLTDEDLIYVSFHNRIYKVPFYVAVDHQTCSIVVTIRGTLSIVDALTDLTAECDHMSTDICPQGFHCHRGMLRAAQFVKRKLEESQALSDAFSLNQSYSLVITGHSLGAGTAAILAMLLRPIYPNLRCFSFSPPGGLLSIDGMKHTEEFVFSVTYGEDLVPRLSMPNMEDMKKKLLNCILDCEQPKYQIFLELLSPCFSKKKKYSIPKTEATAISTSSRPLLENLGQNNSNGNYTTNSSQEGSSEGSVACSHGAGHHHQTAHMPMYLPGRILHITPTDSSFRSHWVTADYFNQIFISPRMLSDHMPHVLQDALKQLSVNTGSFIP